MRIFRPTYSSFKRVPETGAPSPSYVLVSCALAALLATGGFRVGLLDIPSAYAEEATEESTSAQDESESTDETEAPVTGSNPDTSVPDEIDPLTKEVERTSQEYDAANERLAQIEAQIEENEAALATMREDLPEQQERAASAYRAQYELQQESPNIIALFLGSQSLQDFIRNFVYLDHIQAHNAAEIERLQNLKEDLEATQASLDAAREEAATEKESAETALKAAQEAREERQRRAREEAARQAAEAAELAAKAEAAREAAEREAAKQAEEANADKDGDEDSDEDTYDPTQDENYIAPPTETLEPPTADGADWSMGKDAFIAEWGARIDAYLAGSPLSGYGTTFAQAAWNYGVDPRWSPAISNTESSKGAYCFEPYNAWGWGGGNGWTSWEQAIDAHVRGLAAGYGYTITIANAQKYCPPNWEKWYINTSNQMALI
ncbi:hypothetical protein AALA21_07230 [Eggerthellaceae bacterium 3-80]